MHPAPSIILFSTWSGASYGLLFLLGLAAPLGLIPSGRWLGFVAMALALGLVTFGLPPRPSILRRAGRGSAGQAVFAPAVAVLCVSLHVLTFGRELDPHQSPRERTPPDGVSRACR